MDPNAATNKNGSGHAMAGSKMDKHNKDSKDKKHKSKAGAKRQRLLARVAGSIAAGVVQSPSPSITTTDGIAELAIDVAEAILEKAGL